MGNKLTDAQIRLLRSSAAAQRTGSKVHVSPADRNSFRALESKGYMAQEGMFPPYTYYVTEEGMRWAESYGGAKGSENFSFKRTFQHGGKIYRLTYDIGDTVKWESKAKGSVKEKRGKVLAIVLPHENARGHLPEGTAMTALLGNETSTEVRVLVEVPRGGKSKKSDYYCPRVSTPKLVEEGSEA